MDQASPQCMDDDSSLAAYQHDERLPKIVVHFPVMRREPLGRWLVRLAALGLGALAPR